MLVELNDALRRTFAGKRNFYLCCTIRDHSHHSLDPYTGVTPHPMGGPSVYASTDIVRISGARTGAKLHGHHS